MDKVAWVHTLLLVLRSSPVRIVPSTLHLIFIFAVTLNEMYDRANPASLATQVMELFRKHGRKIIMLLSIHGVTAVSVTS